MGMNGYYRCHACKFPANANEEGVDQMRKHIANAHRGDRKVKIVNVYVEFVRERPGR
jgi:hypothetical protein